MTNMINPQTIVRMDTSMFSNYADRPDAVRTHSWLSALALRQIQEDLHDMQVKCSVDLHRMAMIAAPHGLHCIDNKAIHTVGCLDKKPLGALQ